MTSRWYPKEWRERYGADLEAYLADEYGSGRVPLGTKASLIAGGLTHFEEQGFTKTLNSDGRRGPCRLTASSIAALRVSVTKTRRIADVGSSRLGLSARLLPGLS